jgi:hypothetical protein
MLFYQHNNADFGDIYESSVVITHYSDYTIHQTAGMQRCAHAHRHCMACNRVMHNDE